MIIWINGTVNTYYLRCDPVVHTRRVVMEILAKSGIFDKDSSERQSNIKSSDYDSIKNLKT